jgi:hypothetical protein
MSIAYTKGMMLERVKKHLNDGFASGDFTISDNEVLLYIDEQIPFVLKSQVFENAKVNGIFEVPDAYLLTYELTLTQKTSTKEWYATLPQTPLALPSGYQITDAYFTSNGSRGQALFFLSPKRTSYRNLLPKPAGIFARLEGNKIYLQSYNGSTLLNQTLNIQMPISRTASVTDVMNLPDDSISLIFDKVVAKILGRYNIPQDVVHDSLPAGNKTS